MTLEKQEQKKETYPRAIVGAFIFNDKNELFLMSSSKWSNKFVCPGGGVEFGEKLEIALEREVKEETNMDIENVEFLGFIDAYDTGKSYIKEGSHLLFFNFKARVKGEPEIILDEEAVGHKWLKAEDWLKEDLGEYVKNAIEKYLLGEKEDFEYLYKRALADYQNLSKQTAREKQEFAKYANEQLILEFIPVYDNLKTSLKHADEKANGWLEGVKYVTKQFGDVFKNFGVEEIKTEGEKFDHNTMESVDTEKTDDNDKDGMVAKEVSAGYRMGEKVIKAARVIVYEV
ncbi:MAG: nucleotide exchange factor GrpE [Patescibacteria group bacterium]